MKTNKANKNDLKYVFDTELDKNKKPNERDKNKDGYFYSGLYKGFVPGLYAGGR